jgi:hypothetical protein
MGPWINNVMYTLSQIGGSQATGGSAEGLDDDIVGMVEQAYQIISHTGARLNGRKAKWFERFAMSDFVDLKAPLPGFAAFFRCPN